MNRRRRKTQGLTRCGHRARTPDEIHEEGEIHEIEHLVKLLQSAGVTVEVDRGQLVVTFAPSRLGPGVNAALETLRGRELLVRRVLEGGAA
ncbi:MAG TPA: hypothetical protein VF316_04500 [Polyangiaceae bacterium]